MTVFTPALSTQHAALPQPLPLPLPKIDVAIREATPDDLPFIDDLQKQHCKQVGFLQRAALEGKIALRQTFIAESHGQPVGYSISSDKYRYHDNVGLVTQLNVVPGKQRGLIGATLLQDIFDRAAYGCRLFCCWCAQDLAANNFWEAMGFVPLAFRAGSEKKRRVHIFWQKRIRRGDVTTPWWYPSETGGGMIREDRIALPIPPGVHWSEAKPIVLPGMEFIGSVIEDKTVRKALPGPRAKKAKAVEPPRESRQGTLWFAPPPTAIETMPKAEEKPREKRNNPQLKAMARELRDRWLEQVNSSPLLPGGKYAVGKPIGDAATPRKLLAA